MRRLRRQHLHQSSVTVLEASGVLVVFGQEAATVLCLDIVLIVVGVVV